MAVNQNWQVEPELQLEFVKRLNIKHNWGFSEADFPPAPVNPPPLSREEGLLFTVRLKRKGFQTGLQRTFDDPWEAIKPPKGYLKRREMLRSDSSSLRLAPGYEYVPGASWVVFNPTAFEEVSPEEVLAVYETARRDFRPAGLEVLMAALLCPLLVSSWGKTMPYPNMSALQVYWHGVGEWNITPTLRLEGTAALGRLRLVGTMSDYASSYACSPTVREL